MRTQQSSYLQRENPEVISRICPIESVTEVAHNTFILSFVSPEISESVLPGQFVNVRGWEGYDPLLRRPFSVYWTSGREVSIVFNVVGRGTSLLSRMKRGDRLDVIGPLGNSFSCHDGFETGVVIGGGLGVAPLPLTIRALVKHEKNVLCFVGARSSDSLVMNYLEDAVVATDDGTRGFSGTVVDLARETLGTLPIATSRIFACGPTPMLRSVSTLASDLGIRCELSLEGPMGCGFGICQGCPVEMSSGERRFALMCKDGPVFSSTSVVL
jgi:dihydroorotate dehydrogenase electron transfer subunit